METLAHKPNVQPSMKEVQPPSPPPSSTTSPSHEFSFTISLSPPLSADDKTQSLPPPLADLSPADEIFFHGHLLPLHILSHHPTVSPRSSTNSLDSFITFTIKDESLHNDIVLNNEDPIDIDDHRPETSSHDDSEGKVSASKLRSISHLFLKWIKHHHHHHHHHHHDHHHDHDHESEYGHNLEDDERHHDDHHHHKHRIWRPKFNVVKRYISLVKPFIHIPFAKHKRTAGESGGPNELFLRHPASFNSYAGSLRVRKSSKDGLVIRAGMRSEFSSAPVSIKTSPTNSGVLVASRELTPTVAFKNDSSVEELHAAIQAAIAHCKNSSNLVEGDKEKPDKMLLN